MRILNLKTTVQKFTVFHSGGIACSLSQKKISSPDCYLVAIHSASFPVKNRLSCGTLGTEPGIVGSFAFAEIVSFVL